MAPVITELGDQPSNAEIRFDDELSSVAVRVVRKFKTYINLFFIVRFDVNVFGVEFIPENDCEREQIAVLKFDLQSTPKKTNIPFSMIAQAIFAEETGKDNPSFASTLAQMAKQALIERQFIEAFRYSFLMFEGLYGEGKFKTTQLVEAMSGNKSFVSAIDQTIQELMIDPLHRDDKARRLIAKHQTPIDLIRHMIDRRGFYFHGNTTRHDAWKPDEQVSAEELAALTVLLAFNIAMSLAEAMFTPEIASRYFKNAETMGAIVSIVIQYVLRHEDGTLEPGTFKGNLPGTFPSNKLAVHLHKEFLDYVEHELHPAELVEAVGRDLTSGREVFRARYIGATASETRSPD